MSIMHAEPRVLAATPRGTAVDPTRAECSGGGPDDEVWFRPPLIWCPC